MDGDVADTNETLYYTNDANPNGTRTGMNVTALVDAVGDVVERTMYDPYGKVTVLDAGWHGGRRSGLPLAQPASVPPPRGQHATGRGAVRLYA